MSNDKEITRICVFAAVFDVILDVEGELGTSEDDFYLTRIFAACTSG